jgi:putative acetyltransferase
VRGSTKIGSLSKDRIVIQQIQHNEADHLLDSSTRYMESLYPAESNHLVDVEELLQPRNHFLGAFIEGRAVGCVALITKSSYAEIKRLFVTENHRRAKIGLRLMQEIESLASQNHIRLLRLETGIHQPTSIQFYESMGYQHIGPFGEYQADPLSIFMEKSLSPA